MTSEQTLLRRIKLFTWLFTFGAVRGIPFWWRLIDCSFGIFGIIPLFLCKQWTAQLEAQAT